MVLLLLIAFIFWLVQVARVTLNVFKLLEIKSFYRDALHITEVCKQHKPFCFLYVNYQLLESCMGTNIGVETKQL